MYVEVEPDELTGFVRDEGKGFDPDQVPTYSHSTFVRGIHHLPVEFTPTP